MGSQHHTHGPLFINDMANQVQERILSTAAFPNPLIRNLCSHTRTHTHIHTHTHTHTHTITTDLGPLLGHLVPRHVDGELSLLSHETGQVQWEAIGVVQTPCHITCVCVCVCVCMCVCVCVCVLCVCVCVCVCRHVCVCVCANMPV